MRKLSDVYGLPLWHLSEWETWIDPTGPDCVSVHTACGTYLTSRCN